jgi:syntaxin 7
MSFNTTIDLESQKSFTDSPEFDQLVEQASNWLLEVNNHLITLNKLLKSLGSRDLKGSQGVNDKCVSSIELLTELFKSLGDIIKRLNEYDELNPSQQFTKDKVTRELRGSLDEFQSAQDKFTKLTSTINKEARIAMESHTAEEPTAIRQQMILEQDQVNNEEVIYQQNLIQEREEEIVNIEHGIQELNEIFEDLGTIVQEQGVMVDNIESNIYDIANSTRDASGQLDRALRYQRRSGRRNLCMLMIIGIILLVVILVIVI